MSWQVRTAEEFTIIADSTGTGDVVLQFTDGKHMELQVWIPKKEMQHVIHALSKAYEAEVIVAGIVP